MKIRISVSSADIVPMIKIPDVKTLNDEFRVLTKPISNPDSKVLTLFKKLYQIYKISSDTGPYRISDEAFDLLADNRLASNVLNVANAQSDKTVMEWMAKFEVDPTQIKTVRVATKESLKKAGKENKLKAAKAFADLFKKAKEAAANQKSAHLAKLNSLVVKFSDLLAEERQYLPVKEVKVYEAFIKLLNLEISLHDEKLTPVEKASLLKQRNFADIQLKKLGGENPFTFV